MIGKRSIIRLFLAVFIIVVIMIAIPQLILSFPGMLFREKLSKAHIVLSSDQPIDPSLSTKLDSISETFSRSGFFSHKESLHIYFCHDETLASFFDEISDAPSGAGFHHFSGNIFLFPERISRFRTENSRASQEERLLLQYSYQGFNLTDLMAHEGFHALHSDTLGIWTFRKKMPPPHWKAEGFAEYYTYLDQKRRDSTYNFHERVRLYLKYKDRFPLFYFRSELLYEFLVEHQHLDFAAIMDDALTEEQAYETLVSWCNTESR